MPTRVSLIVRPMAWAPQAPSQSNRKTGYAPGLGTGFETRTTVNITKLPELLRRGR
jgi:hypothetical protein